MIPKQLVLRQLLVTIAFTVTLAGNVSAQSTGIAIVAADDFEIQGETSLHPGGARPAVLLLHQCGGSRGDWTGLSQSLFDRGFNVIAIDMRGHGESTSDTWDVAAIRAAATSREDYFQRFEKLTAHWPCDLDQALEYVRSLPQVQSDNISLVAASCMAGQSVGALNRGHDLRALAFVSPSLRERTMQMDWWAAVGAENAPPLLLLAANADEPTYTESQKAFSLIKHSNSRFVSVIGQAHGRALLENHPDTARIVVDWLTENANVDAFLAPDE